MTFIWDDDRIRWYEQASGYSDFHRRLADFLLPYLLPNDRICDWGAGLGRLSLELAPHVAHIDCVDQDARVLKTLEEEAGRRGIHNITTHAGRVQDMDLVGDVSLMVFFGTPVQLMFSLLDRTFRLLIRVMNADRPGLPPGRETAQEVREALERAGIPFQVLGARLEFGQPFLSWDDADAYLARYGGDRGALVETRDSRYPLYLPKGKDLLLLLVEGQGQTY